MAEGQEGRPRARAWAAAVGEARRRAGYAWPAEAGAGLARLRGVAVGMGAGRGRARPAAALAAGRLRLRHRSLLHRRARTGLVGGLRRGRCRHRDGRRGAPQQRGLSAGARLRCAGGRLRRCDHADPAHRASGAAISGIERIGQRLRRDARGARAQRPRGHPRHAPRSAAPHREARARAHRGAQGHRAGGRQLRRIESASVAAIGPVETGRLRLRARHVFPGDRRLRLRARQDQDRAAKSRTRLLAALCGDRRRHPREHRRPHPFETRRATAARSPRR